MRFLSAILLPLMPLFCQSLELSPLHMIEGPVQALAFAHAGERMALVRNGLLYVGDVRTGVQLQEAGRLSSTETSVLALSRNGDLVAIASANQIQLQGEQPKERRSITLERNDIVQSLAFSTDAKRLLVVGSRSIRIIELALEDKAVMIPLARKKTLLMGAFRADAGTLLFVSADGTIIEWSLETQKVSREIRGPERILHAAALSNGGNILVLAAERTRLLQGSPFGSSNPSEFERTYRMNVYDLARGALAKEFALTSGPIVSLSLSADARYAAGHRVRLGAAETVIVDLGRGVETALVADAPPTAGQCAPIFSNSGTVLAAPDRTCAMRLLETKGVGLASQSGDLAGVRIRLVGTTREPLLSGEKPVTIAILDFEAPTADPTLGRAVSDMLRSRLSGVKNIRFVERSRMQQLIGEQNFQNSDRADINSAVKLGRLLGAEKMVFGSVSRLGRTFTINVRLVDVETAVVEGVREVLCQQCTDEDLPGAIAELSASVARF
jgi:TolB-like protein